MGRVINDPFRTAGAGAFPFVPTKSAYLAPGASNGKKRTQLTLSASRNGPDKRVVSGGGYITWVPVILSGRLTSEGSGVAGAHIIFSCDGEPCEFQENVGGDKTNSTGHYSVGVLVGHKWKIEAGYLGDQIANEHLHLQSSEASTKVK